MSGFAPASSSTRSGVKWNSGGSFSQYYRRDVFEVDGATSTVLQSQLVNDLDLFGRARGDDYHVEARFNGGYSYSFLDDGDDLSRISLLYLDAGSRILGLSGRLGRQSASTGGVFDRFDGLTLRFQTRLPLRINLLGGYPVANSRTTSVETGRSFVGGSLDLGTFAGIWDFTIYALDQENDGLTDRRAVGGEARLIDERRAVIALVDYDTYFQELNIASLFANWNLSEMTSLSLSANQGKTPFLTLDNALIGQEAAGIRELLQTHTADEIRELARDRTATSRSVTLGATQRLQERLQLSADVTVSNLSDTPSSGGVPGTDESGNEYRYALQLFRRDLLQPGDLTIAGLVLADNDLYTMTTLHLNARYRIGRAFRINPRLRVDYRELEQTDSRQWTVLPSIRIDYRHGRTALFEFEAGLERTERETAILDETTTGYYISAGYSLGF